MRSIIFVSFLMVSNAYAAGESVQVDIKGLSSGMTPADFVTKVKSIYKDCKIEQNIEKYKTMTDSVSRIRLVSAGCVFEADASFGMVDQKSFMVELSESFPGDKILLPQDVSKSLKDKYGVPSGGFLGQVYERLEWLYLPGNGMVISNKEYESKKMSDCSYSGLSDYVDMSLDKPGIFSKDCSPYVNAMINTNGSYVRSYTVKIADVSFAKKLWENDVKVFRERRENENKSIEKALKANSNALKF